MFVDKFCIRKILILLLSIVTLSIICTAFAAGHQQQTIQIPPILTQLDLLQKQLLLQQQAQQQLGVGPNGVNVGTNIPQVDLT